MRKIGSKFIRYKVRIKRVKFDVEFLYIDVVLNYLIVKLFFS